MYHDYWMVKEIKIERGKIRKYPSLFDHFKPGERVVRSVRNNDGDIKVYEGIIMALDDDKMEVYWDTLDGRYRPEVIGNDFTLCSADEVLDGNTDFSPIKHKKQSYIAW
jgi:hypothetical protein